MAHVYDDQLFVEGSPTLKSKYAEFGLIKSILKGSHNQIQYLKPKMSAVSLGPLFMEDNNKDRKKFKQQAVAVKMRGRGRRPQSIQRTIVEAIPSFLSTPTRSYYSSEDGGGEECDTPSMVTYFQGGDNLGKVTFLRKGK